MTIADTIWVAASLLHHFDPNRAGFDHATLLRKVLELDPSLNPRSVSTHLSTHCVASKKADPSNHRILSENPDGTLRLYRSGDPCHPTRTDGRIQPKVLPEQYGWLLAGGGSEATSKERMNPSKDPILGLAGVGKELWESLGGGEAFLHALRQEWWPGHEPASQEWNQIWERIKAHQGQEFRTLKGKSFSYELNSNVMIVWRKQRPVDSLPQSEFERAWTRRSQIHDPQRPPYLFAILTDPRITS
ncbi:MAG TPA: hypothetical protein VGP79_16645 [Bryobacteraceae bacterium]|jgi:hypothetical protein|nr:hypothetical protein [Bryobacteraceae bacterium]